MLLINRAVGRDGRDRILKAASRAASISRADSTTQASTLRKASFLECLAVPGQTLAHGGEALKACQDADLAMPGIDQMLDCPVAARSY